MEQTYKNKKPRFGSPDWCKEVVSNESLTPSDHGRIAKALAKTGNLKALCTIHKLLTRKP